MRIKHFFGLAVLAAMTASCSSNDELVNGGNGSGENESGASYASFSINLPTTRGTRAGSDPEFNQGTTNEYDVYNATLLVFKKGTTAGEGNYTLAEKVDLGSMEPWKNPSETGVTTQAKITAKLSNVDKSGDYFALVLLNNGSGADAKVNLPADGTTTTYSAWNKADNANYTNFTDTKKGFYMANAPLYNATDKSVTTLVAIDKSKIFPTEAQASSGEAAADIYVERGLAKVTLTTATGYEDVGGSTYVGDKVKISNWALDVTNKKTFPIHNVDGLTEDYAAIWNNKAATTPGEASNQRFVDNNESTKAKRVYWGVDPNYKENALCDVAGTTARAENFNYIKKEKLTAKPTEPLYCLENTFNLENMKQGQTTRVIFKASYTPKGFTAADGKTFYKVGTSVALWKQKDLEDHIKAAVSKVFSVTTTDDITIKLDAKDNDITAAGNHVITAANFTVKGHDTVSKAEEKAVNDKVGLIEKAGISTYANGESYYIARIKHFGDALTPWNSGETYNDNLKYLGRYGMLRNNWYVLDVQSVSGPGYPDVPEVKPNTPDDEDDKYIKVSVKILDWAKRSQSVDL